MIVICHQWDFTMRSHIANNVSENRKGGSNMEKTKIKMTMYEMINEHFERIDDGFKCKRCGQVCHKISYVSKHWRTTHQHETRIYIERMKIPKNVI